MLPLEAPLQETSVWDTTETTGIVAIETVLETVEVQPVELVAVTV
jgi:hypothetical protein